MAEETGAAFGIYPSAGRRPERLNQSRGVNAPLQLLRGWAAGTLGLPGDIEGLVRMLPGIKNETPAMPTSDFYREWLPGYDERPAARAMSGLGALAGGVGATRVAGAGLGALKRATDVNAIRDYIRATQGVSGMPGAAVVKPRGGNWLAGAGSPEEAVRGLKATAVGMDPAERIPLLDNLIREQEAAGAVTPEFLDRMRAERGRLTGDAELNRWIDQKLAKYIRNEMGTPEDPVRALAERGITHMQNVPEVDTTAWTMTARREAGFPKKGMAQSPLARSWENLTDEMIAAQSAGRLRGAMSEYEGAKMTSDIHAGIERNLVKERVRQLEDAFKDTPSKDLADEFNLDYEVTDANRSQAIKDWAENEVKGYFRGNEEDMLGPQYAHKIGLEAREAARQGQDLSWLTKVPEDQPVYSLMKQEDAGLNLEFGHLVDELRNATRAGTDLPRELQLRPEQLSKVTMPQAVELVDRINTWRAAQKAEANLARSTNVATQTFKEYPEAGYRWVEIKTPNMDLPEGAKRVQYSATQGGIDVPGVGVVPAKWSAEKGLDWESAEAAAKRVIAREPLESALKYEGEVMGHCVGGYCPDVMEGRSRIFSLRDAKGQPHVTVEVRPEKQRDKYYTDWMRQQPEAIQDEVTAAAIEYNAANPKLGYGESLNKVLRDRIGEAPDEIIQIKGKANRAPKEEYLPYVQDFVKSQRWGRVGDLSNTGLIPIDSTSDLAKSIRAAGGEPPRFVTQQELTELLRQNANPAKGYARGGAVSDNKNDWLSLLERNGVQPPEGYAGGGVVKFLQGMLTRAPAKSAKEIEAIAERMAPQVTGEYVRIKPESAVTVAGKTKKQFEREKDLPVDIRMSAEEKISQPIDIESLKDNVMIGIRGDPTVTARDLYGVGKTVLERPSPQFGGPQYGLYHDKDHFWASGLGAARRVQNLVKEASEQYDAPVLGKYIMMGPESINYAQHFADANLQAIDLSKMNKRQIEGFNRLIRMGSPKSGPRPSFPGIQDKDAAYLHFAEDPELRKYFNQLMQQNTVVDSFNLPSGQDIRFAITEPSLSNLETGVTGYSVGRMRPDIPSSQLKTSEHPTYSHDIPGQFLGSTRYPVPYELSFPDTLKAVRENPKQAPQEFGSLNMVGPRQIVDQQLIDEIKAYEERMKALTGKKKGGLVQGYADGGAVSTVQYDPAEVEARAAALMEEIYA